MTTAPAAELRSTDELEAARYHRLRFEHDYAREIVAVRDAAKLKPERVVAIVRALARAGLLVHRKYAHEQVAELVSERDELQNQLDERPDQAEPADFELDEQINQFSTACSQIRHALSSLDKLERDDPSDGPEPELYSVLFNLRSTIERALDPVDP